MTDPNMNQQQTFHAGVRPQNATRNNMLGQKKQEQLCSTRKKANTSPKIQRRAVVQGVYLSHEDLLQKFNSFESDNNTPETPTTPVVEVPLKEATPQSPNLSREQTKTTTNVNTNSQDNQNSPPKNAIPSPTAPFTPVTPQISNENSNEKLSSEVPFKKLQSIVSKFATLHGSPPPKDLSTLLKPLPQSKKKFAEWLEENSTMDFPAEISGYSVEDKHLKWVIKFIVGSTKNLTIKVTAAKFMCSLAWPNELQLNLRKKIYFSGLLPFVLQLGREGHLTFHHHIERSDLLLQEFMTKGAGGKIYKGVWNGKPVAIKFCGAEGIFFGSIEDFRFEVSAMSLLEHQHVLSCYGANAKDAEPFIVLPLKQFSLDDLFNKNTALRPDLRVKIALQIADALEYLHSCKILHRDLKPSNVLLDFQHNVTLCDFGISRICDTKRPMTLNVGTTEWIAPEVFSGDGNYTPMVDIYSYGMILYQLFAGKKPFKSISLFDIPGKVADGDRPDIPEDIPPALSQLIGNCWHHNPTKRPGFQLINEVLLQHLKSVQRRPTATKKDVTAKESQ